MYTAAVLSAQSKLALKQTLQALVDLQTHGFEFLTAQGQALPHHMTINLGSFDPELNDGFALGQKAALQVDSIYYDTELGVCAAKVSEAKAFVNKDWVQINTINDTKHITLCLRKGSKPYLSNVLFQSEAARLLPLPDSLALEAVIEECQ